MGTKIGKITNQFTNHFMKDLYLEITHTYTYLYIYTYTYTTRADRQFVTMPFHDEKII